MNRREKALIYFCFMLTLACAMAVIGANANEVLNLVTDTYDNEKWVSKLDNTVVNTTEGLLKLDTTPIFTEDLTTWTELDGAGIYTVNTDSVVVTDSQPNHDGSRVYLNAGADNIGDYDITFEMEVTKISSSVAPAIKIMIF